MSNLYELFWCPNLARQNHRVLTLLPHSLSSTATSPLSDSYREVGDFGIIAVPFDLGIISLYMSTMENKTAIRLLSHAITLEVVVSSGSLGFPVLLLI